MTGIEKHIKPSETFHYSSRFATLCAQKIYEGYYNVSVFPDPKLFSSGIKSFKSVNAESDCDFIAHARTDIPFLLAQLEAARREVGAVKDVLGELLDAHDLED